MYWYAFFSTCVHMIKTIVAWNPTSRCTLSQHTMDSVTKIVGRMSLFLLNFTHTPHKHLEIRLSSTDFITSRPNNWTSTHSESFCSTSSKRKKRNEKFKRNIRKKYLPAMYGCIWWEQLSRAELISSWTVFITRSTYTHTHFYIAKKPIRILTLTQSTANHAMNKTTRQSIRI